MDCVRGQGQQHVELCVVVDINIDAHSGIALRGPETVGHLVSILEHIAANLSAGEVVRESHSVQSGTIGWQALANRRSGRDAATRRLRRHSANFHTVKSLASWRAEDSTITEPTQNSLITQEWIGRAKNLVIAGPVVIAGSSAI
ncbi:hypothetical protein [Streptomyces sp. DT203]|uniref:hypothetical protein n=1 Tax=Streptomyces sp. DT203 TaxID=3393424 RepID=UPI003CF38545